jgi:hypothetical protein
MAWVAGIAVWIASALLGRWLLGLAGLTNFCLLGGAFVLGNGILGFCLQIWLRCFGTGYGLDVVTGCVVLIVGSIGGLNSLFQGHRRQAASQRPCYSVSRYDLIAYALVVVWLGCVVSVYIPLFGFAATPTHNFPDVFDLPKHLFALRSAFDAQGWPVSNAFFYGEPFTYNFLFYMPPALAAKLAGDRLAIFSEFPIFLVATALALPLTVSDVTRAITDSRPIRVTVVAFATLVGGFTPLIVTGVPALGYVLHVDRLLVDQVWIEETFTYAIYVPQHLFAVLCAVVSTVTLSSIEGGEFRWSRVAIASCATTAGALSSLILLPLLLASFGIGGSLVFASFSRAKKVQLLRSPSNAAMAAAALLPILVLGVFVVEARAWSSDVVMPFRIPNLGQQWFYVAGCLGLLIPLTLVGLPFLAYRTQWSGAAGRQLAGMLGLVLVGLLAIVFAGYPDGGLKAGLLLRVVLVIPVGLGLFSILETIESTVVRRALLFGAGSACLMLAAINAPLIAYFVKSAWRPLDPSIRALVIAVRDLPPTSRVAMWPPDQRVGAMLGRQVDFDFSTLRDDSYLPASSRESTNRFWRGVASGDVQALELLRKRYDYLITVVQGRPDDQSDAHNRPIGRYGRYIIYQLADGG